MMKVTNNAQDRILEEIQKTWDKMNKDLQASPPAQASLDHVYRAITRRIFQFQSSRIIIISAGMLKAGKSTLVNLLARTNNASPVGYGYDTTLNPALIRMGPLEESQGYIYVYDVPEHEVEQNGVSSDGALQDDIFCDKRRQEALQTVLDELRGLETKKTVTKRKFKLNQENLTNALCKKYSESGGILKGEPLLVVVQTPYNPESLLLSEQGCACILLDMPGLDSGNADISRLTSDYLAIIKESDLLLFVQSSVAPLNDKASACLERIKEERREATYRVIQNSMEAKHWLKKERIKQEQDNQIEHAKEVFKSLVPDANLHIDRANLGMAYQGIFGRTEELAEKDYLLENGEEVTPNQLWEYSGFRSIEENLLSDLSDNGRKNRLIHCYTTLGNAAKTHERELEALSSEYESRRAKVKKDETNWDEILAEVVNWSQDYRFKDKLQFCLKEKFRSDSADEICKIVEGAQRQAGHVSTSLREEVKLKGSKIDAFLEDCSRKIKEYMENIMNEISLEDVQDGNGNSAIKFCTDKLEEVKKEFQYKAEKSDDKAQGYKKMMDKVHFNCKLDKNLCKFNKDLVNLELYEPLTFKQERAWFPWMEKKIRISPQEPIWLEDLDKMKEFYWKQCEDLVRRKAKEVVADTIKQGLSSSLQGYVNEVKIQKEIKAKEMDILEMDISIINRYLGHLKEIPVKLDSFLNL